MADAKIKVLIAEDDPFMASLLYEAFTKDGFEVVAAGDGTQAVQQFRDAKPNVLLIDILLPIKNGIEALREIRALPEGVSVPALILSNFEESTYIREAQQLKVKAYLVKANVELPEIVARVKQVLAEAALA